jgi:RNA polymerase sigma factor (sigma-70 family)
MIEQADEQALMAAYARGDTQVFPQLFRVIAPRLLAFFRRTVSDASLCDDLLQTTFVRLHGARDRYRPGAPIWPWLFTIAARVRIDELRRRQRRPTSGELDLERIPAPEDSAAAGIGLDDAARARTVHEALDQLPATHREVIHLHRFEGLSFAEIGTALGISAGAARIRAFRAYAVLREKLLPLSQEGS